MYTLLSIMGAAGMGFEVGRKEDAITAPEVLFSLVLHVHSGNIIN